MMAFVLGQKITQSQRFDEKNHRYNTTHLEAANCYVTQLKTKTVDGYWGVQLGISTRSTQNITKSQLGKTKKAGITTPLSFFKEIRLSDKLTPTLVEEEGKQGIKVGDRVYFIGMLLAPNNLFQAGDLVQVTAQSKGKGFAGVMKRHGFAGGPATHGQSDRARAPGSIGSRTIPGRVFKGKKMAGRMGNDQITIKGLTIVEATENTIVIRGLVPGGIHTNVLVKTQRRNG